MKQENQPQAPTYRRKQTNLPIMIGSLLVAVFGLVALFAGDPPEVMTFILPVLAAVYLLILAIVPGFTIKIDAEHLTWHYGLGAFKKKVALKQITGVEIMEKIKAMQVGALGVTYTPEGDAYNHWVGKGVRVTTKTRGGWDKAYVIGTDEPEQVKEAIEAAMRPAMLDEAEERIDFSETSPTKAPERVKR